MPKIADLTNLFRAIAAQDWTTARTMARAIADAEEEVGHRSAAKALRGALVSNGHLHGKVQPLNGFGPNLPLLPLAAKGALQEIHLTPKASESVRQVLGEWANRDQLLRHGMRPRQKMLFLGPPGCGKTMTATAVASELSLPAFLVRFDSLIGSFLGQTAARIAELFAFARETACVLVFDEVDALGTRRGMQRDVGELDRVVIALMQQLEHVVPAGLVVATSNMPEQLDPALLRRFDLTIEFPSPTAAQLHDYLRVEAEKAGLSFPENLMDEADDLQNYADASALVHTWRRRELLGTDCESAAPT